MNMTPRWQKFALLAHISSSIGWFGAVLPYLALAVTGLTSRNEQMVRAAYLSMELIGWYVIVPCSVAALLSGLVMSFGTKWGLFRHWWIVAKLFLTVVAVAVLLRHMAMVSAVSRMAATMPALGDDFRTQQIGLLVHPSGGLLVLLAIMALSVFKPWGMTPLGRRRPAPIESAPRMGGEVVTFHGPVAAVMKPRWGRIIGFHLAALAVLFAVLHIVGVHHH